MIDQMEEVWLTYCEDRSCDWQQFGPHVHNAESETPIIPGFARLNATLEKQKTARGRKCWNCGKWLIPSDKDHSFCDPCWVEMLAHPFTDHGDGTCSRCNKTEDDIYHTKYKELYPE